MKFMLLMSLRLDSSMLAGETNELSLCFCDDALTGIDILSFDDLIDNDKIFWADFPSLKSVFLRVDGRLLNVLLSSACLRLTNENNFSELFFMRLNLGMLSLGVRTGIVYDLYLKYCLRQFIVSSIALFLLVR